MAFDQHRARAALAGIAADVSSGEVERVAKDVHQKRSGFDLERVGHAIDGESDRVRHEAGLLAAARVGPNWKA
jgi:hypothetical protein